MTDDELNRELAEKVMGWRIDGRVWVRNDPDGGVTVMFFLGEFEPDRLPDHTAMVMEKMRELGWVISIVSLVPNDGWRSTVWRPAHEKDRGPPALAAADTWPRAVCLAALRAVEEG